MTGRELSLAEQVDAAERAVHVSRQRLRHTQAALREEASLRLVEWGLMTAAVAVVGWIVLPRKARPVKALSIVLSQAVSFAWPWIMRGITRVLN